MFYWENSHFSFWKYHWLFVNVDVVGILPQAFFLLTSPISHPPSWFQITSCGAPANRPNRICSSPYGILSPIQQVLAGSSNSTLAYHTTHWESYTFWKYVIFHDVYRLLGFIIIHRIWMWDMKPKEMFSCSVPEGDYWLSISRILLLHWRVHIVAGRERCLRDRSWLMIQENPMLTFFT